ncbi:MAG: AlpA family phage regulatory protein [Bacteriovorax sp.]|nr:AlpA family phage regulatory protein [Rhizobacter sp.]
MRRSVSPTGSAALPTALALILRMGAVMQVTGMARSTIYKPIAEDKFLQPVQLTGRAVAWRRADLERWSAARPTVTH